MENPVFVKAWEAFKLTETYKLYCYRISIGPRDERVERMIKHIFQTGWNARPIEDCKPDKQY